MRCYTIGVHYTYLDLPPKPSIWLGCETPNYIRKIRYTTSTTCAKACLINLGHLKTKVRRGGTVVSGHPVQATRLYQLTTYLSTEKIISSLVHLD